jgi:hypothetical protein
MDNGPDGPTEGVPLAIAGSPRAVHQYSAEKPQEMYILQEARPCGRGVLEETAQKTPAQGPCPEG